MISYKLKGIILAVILSLASIMMPFNIYASVQSQIVPTFSSSTSQWNGHLYVTNFSDGTNNQASSTLSFTFDDDYYGIIYFDGYGPSNQHIANYATCFVAGGYGEYRYSYYQNGIINITSVTINIVSVVKPETTVDLTQIITLLTAIENDTSSIDNVLDTTLAQIRLVLAELIESNGYLETLTKYRQWNFPVESLSFVYQCEEYGNEIIDLFTLSNWIYPVFNVKTNNIIGVTTIYRNDANTVARYAQYVLWVGTSQINNLSRLNTYFSPGNQCEFYDFKTLQNTNKSFIISFKVRVLSNAPNNSYQTQLKYIGTDDLKVIPIYQGREIREDSNLSTDFALQYGLSNRFLDNIEIIANGTSQSNSAASDLESEASEYSDIADDVIGVEEGLTSNFETEVNKIDLNTGLNVFGGNFMTSATWVRTQFDRLTENTPYGSLVVYGLTLGFALLMLGKVFL